MENIFAKRRARLLAMKAMRENYVPGEKLVTCPHCGGESQRKDVAAALSVCPLCGYHFPMEPEWYVQNVFDKGSVFEFNREIEAGNPLNFPNFEERIKAAQEKTVQTAKEDVTAAMDAAVRSIEQNQGPVAADEARKAMIQALKAREAQNGCDGCCGCKHGEDK